MAQNLIILFIYLIFNFNFIFIVSYFNFNQLRLNSEKNCLISLKLKKKTTLNLLNECILFFLHFHKTGGSTICSMAIKEGYKSNQIDNCQTNLINRNNEYNYTINNKFNFISSEGLFFQPNLNSNKIIYFTTIRNPYDRIISQLHHELCENQNEGQGFISNEMGSRLSELLRCLEN